VSAQLDGLTRGLVPEGVRLAAERLQEAAAADFRFAEEAAAVEGAIAKRQVEHAAGRRLAHELFDVLRAEGLAVAQAPLLAGTDRAPVWPEGLTGTITHTRGLCMVAVAPVAELASLGLDVEVTEPLKEKLWPSILTVSERARLTGLGARGALLSKVHFSAKEAVYKAVSKAAGRVLEFEEVELSVSLVKGTFEARFLDAELAVRLPRVGGVWRVTRDFIATSAWPRT
jgi:4'-phosphopantetheinyl transferase EntD